MEGDLITNGTLLTSTIAKKIVTLGWDTIFFSIHGSKPEIDEKIRGRKAFKETLRGIDFVNHWKNELQSSKPKLGVIMVITRDNYFDVKNLVALSKTIGIEKVMIRMVNENLEKGISDIFIRKEQLPFFLKEMKMAQKFAQNNNIQLEADFSLKDVNRYALKRRLKNTNILANVPCKIPFEEMVIFADGRTSQCCNFFDSSNEVIDYIAEKTIREVWYGEHFEKLRKMMKNGELPERCKFCSLDLLAQRRKL
jgi:radical SAM protein with 4Fe4S-binding SPASM domain